jgi:short subunit dehydrogenase-like uncharacterized protein
MSDPLLIYGATGYTGRLMLSGALALGLRPVIAGRNESRLAALSGPLGLEYRVARLADAAALDRALRDVRVVLHAAGPFSETWRPMVDACLRSGTHYLDITGEIPVIEALAGRNAEARRRKIMLMPAVGFDVVPSDCLAAHVAGRLPGARRLAVGIAGLRFATRGSAKTLVEHAALSVRVRRDGALAAVPPGALQRSFDYGNGLRPSLNISWGDVAAAWYTTGIPDIEVYFDATPALGGMLFASRYFGWILGTAPCQAWLKAHADMLPEGPTDSEREASEMVVVAEAEDSRGRRASARLRTPEAYTFTGTTGPAIARRVLRGDLEPGFQTPGRVYGGDFVLSFAGVSREDLE